MHGKERTKAQQDRAREPASGTRTLKPKQRIARAGGSLPETTSGKVERMRYPIPSEGLVLATANPSVFLSVAADGETVVLVITETPFADAQEFASIDDAEPFRLGNRYAHRGPGRYAALFIFGTTLPDYARALLA
jgi:hypothetical protein